MGQPLRGPVHSVTTLAGAQQELLNLKLHTIHRLLQKNKPSQGVEVPEPGNGLGVRGRRGRDTGPDTGTYLVLPSPEASMPFPEDSWMEEEDEEAGDMQAGEEPLTWSTETRNIAAPWGVEQGLRRRCSKTAAKGPSPSPLWEGGTTAEGLVKQSLFL